MLDTISRVAALLAGGQEGTLQRCLQNSFLVSADMAHALHPNYPEKWVPHPAAVSLAAQEGPALLELRRRLREPRMPVAGLLCNAWQACALSR